MLLILSTNPRLSLVKSSSLSTLYFLTLSYKSRLSRLRVKRLSQGVLVRLMFLESSAVGGRASVTVVPGTTLSHSMVPCLGTCCSVLNSDQDRISRWWIHWNPFLWSERPGVKGIGIYLFLTTSTIYTRKLLGKLFDILRSVYAAQLKIYVFGFSWVTG